MKLIFVNRYFHPDFSATSQMLSDLAFALSAGGFNVEVVSSRLLYDAPEASLPAQESVRAVRIHRVWSTRFGRRSTFGRLFDYLSFHLTASFKLLWLVSRGDIVVIKTDPPLLSVTAGSVARLRGAVLVNWLQDLFPEVLGAVASKGGIGRKALAALKSLRNVSLRRADRNVAVGRLMARHIAAQGVPPAHIEIIENWCDGDLVRPLSAERNRLREEWGLADAFVVGYSGNLGVAHEFDTIFTAAERLRTHPGVKFLFIGGGSRLPVLENRIRQQGLDNVVFKPYQSRERLTESLSVPDVHLVCLREDMEGLVVPSKFYGVLAAGRPCLFIGDSQGEIATSLRELNCGHTVRTGEGTQLAELIREMADNPSRAREMGATARREFEHRFERSIAIGRWAHVLRGLA